MVNYKLGKIYKIEPKDGGDPGDVYIGSTTNPYLSSRMALHRCGYRRWKEGKHTKITSFDIFDKYNVDNCHIVLVETVPCDTKDELHARERYWIESQNCVNKYITGRTKQEWIENNKDTIITYQKQYRETNRAHIKQYRDANRDVIKAKQRQSYHAKKQQALKSNP